MPEGDTIHRSANRLAAALAGRTLERVEAPRWTGRLPAVGETMEGVDAVGKHLLVRFSGGLVLETHMKMIGSWHLYRPGERWQRAAHRVRVRLDTADWLAVCFDAPVVRFGPARAADRVLEHLGPDLTEGVDDATVAECVSRMARLVDPTAEVADVLRDQRVCCGVGNVYASEVPWALELLPTVPIGEVPDEMRVRMVATAAAQLSANLDRSRRMTVPEGLAVYGRAGKPCRRCGATITSEVRGPHARRTHWCPGCQHEPGAR